MAFKMLFRLRYQHKTDNWEFVLGEKTHMVTTGDVFNTLSEFRRLKDRFESPVKVSKIDFNMAVGEARIAFDNCSREFFGQLLKYLEETVNTFKQTRWYKPTDGQQRVIDP